MRQEMAEKGWESANLPADCSAVETVAPSPRNKDNFPISDDSKAWTTNLLADGGADAHALFDVLSDWTACLAAQDHDIRELAE